MRPNVFETEDVIGVIGAFNGGPYYIVTPGGLVVHPGDTRDLSNYAAIAILAAHLENSAAREAITQPVLPPLRAALHESIGKSVHEG